MVSQIVWLGVKDVFTQIAKVVIRLKMTDSRRKRFSALGFSYTTNVSYNVTYSLMKIDSFLSEED